MKKTILLILTILFIIFLNSCRTKQLVTQTLTTTVRDTIRDYKVITKFNAVHDTLTIDNPCDSAGILTEFYSKIKLPQGQVIIRSVRGKIQATVNIDSIQSVYKNMYRAKENTSSQISTKIVTKTVYPSWLITAFIFETLIILGYIYLKIFYPTTWYRKN